jgi:RNAse (barnase) inhibitor barstar
MRRVAIDESEFRNAEQLHAYLQRKLQFPPYYGRNLSALDDCAGDIDKPTAITVTRVSRPDGRRWFDHIIAVLERAAETNPRLEIIDRR